MHANLKTISVCLAFLSVIYAATGQTNETAAKSNADVPALALVILYDGSGSMRGDVPNLRGEPTPKFQLANNAVLTIAEKMENYCTNRHVTIDAGLVYFTSGKLKVGIPFQKFYAKAYQEWAGKFSSPGGGTPLGEGIEKARELLATSHAIRRHILIVTDGESNVGENPEAVLGRMQSQQDSISVYFVAFDVSAKVFKPVKDLGATVVSASNELQLKTQIDALLGKKILLEAE